jgi:hypothetical protein
MKTEQIKEIERQLIAAKAQSGDTGSWQQSYMTLLYAVDTVIANIALNIADELLSKPEPTTDVLSDKLAAIHQAAKIAMDSGKSKTRLEQLRFIIAESELP